MGYLMINEYMSEKFPGLKLITPLFYNWEIGIRFELGDPDENNEKIYMERVYDRSLSIFKSLHSPNDEVIIVANVHHAGEENSLRRRRVKIFNHYIKSKDVLLKLKHTVIPYVYEDFYDISDFETHRYWLQCHISEIKYVNLIKAICNGSMGLRPKIYHDVFFVNKTKNTIFHIYDNRGCDVISLDKQTIFHLYRNYKDWILDYDKDVIDKIFN